MKKQLMTVKKNFSMAGDSTLPSCLSFIEDTLRENDLDTKSIMRTVLLAEEVVTQLIAHAPEGGQLQVRVRRQFGNVSVLINADGEPFDPFVNPADQPGAIEELSDEEMQQSISSILLKSQGENLKISNKNGTNQVRILVDRANRQMLGQTVAAIALGAACGLLMRFVFPAALSSGLTEYLLSPIQTMFMNALKIVIGPVIFFSIVSCISQFQDLTALGRIGVKVMGMYLMTTVAAVLLAFSVFYVIQPGIPGFALRQAADIAAVEVDTHVDTSILNMIVNIVPSNAIRPLLDSETLQLIFLAVLCGIAVGMVGPYTTVLQELFDALNVLCQTITTLIARLIPLAVFCSVSMMAAKTDAASLSSVLGYVLTILTSLTLMLTLYALLILFPGRLDPLKFFQKCREGMLTSFSLASSSAAMPTNLRVCTDKLGISPKVCSFSIPLGATINMDGNCIFMATCGLFLAKAYGVDVPGSSLLTLTVTVILLSLGCPGVPGAGLVCAGVVLDTLGVPVEAIGIILPIHHFVDMFCTMSNTTGDMMTALVVAKSENLLDQKLYNS